ncbi:hypothetical protein BDR22DRAFT_841133 [Usnea florida]
MLSTSWFSEWLSNHLLAPSAEKLCASISSPLLTYARAYSPLPARRACRGTSLGWPKHLDIAQCHTPAKHRPSSLAPRHIPTRPANLAPTPHGPSGQSPSARQSAPAGTASASPRADLCPCGRSNIRPNR